MRNEREDRHGDRVLSTVGRLDSRAPFAVTLDEYLLDLDETTIGRHARETRSRVPRVILPRRSEASKRASLDREDEIVDRKLAKFAKICDHARYTSLKEYEARYDLSFLDESPPRSTTDASRGLALYASSERAGLRFARRYADTFVDLRGIPRLCKFFERFDPINAPGEHSRQRRCSTLSPTMWI